MYANSQLFVNALPTSCNSEAQTPIPLRNLNVLGRIPSMRTAAGVYRDYRNYPPAYARGLRARGVPPHSSRSAALGSSFDARRAGRKLAPTAIAARTTADIPNVNG